MDFLFTLAHTSQLVTQGGIDLPPDSPVDIDVVYLTGYGFPQYRGGPMFYADELGLDRVLARIEQFRLAHGDDLWAPAPLLSKLASEGKTFGSLGPKFNQAQA